MAKRKYKTEVFAVVDMAYNPDWSIFFRWADSDSKDFQINGKFSTEEEAVFAIPHSIKRIYVQYGDVNKIITR